MSKVSGSSSTVRATPSPIFVVGCPRSGTALVRNLLRSHSRISFPPETHFIPQMYLACGDPRSKVEARRLARRLLRLDKLAEWDCDFELERIVAKSSYAGIIDELFQAWLRKEGKERWGDKTPQNVFHLRVLAEIFPKAKFVHILRDGRDVARSSLLAPVGPENWYSAAQQWQRFVEAGRREGSRLPAGSYLELTYETLLVDTEATLRRLCDFLGEVYEEGMLVPNRLPPKRRRMTGSARVASRLDRQNRSPSRSPQIVHDNAGKWQARLTVKQRAMFESVAGPTLVALGYPNEGLAGPIPRLRRLVWTTDSWVREKWIKLSLVRFWPLLGFAAQLQLARIRSWLRRETQRFR